MKKIVLTFSFALLVIIGVWSEDEVELSLYWENNYDSEIGYYMDINPSFRFTGDFFEAYADLAFLNDGKYEADIANTSDGSMLGFYSLMENGYIDFSYNNFSLNIGQKVQQDIIDSDYSLFVSGNDNSAFGADFVYDGDFLYYETRWIRLNEDSAADFDYTGDRGANLKTYALKLDKFRIGFQDAAVYIDRSFDLEYFANPIPQYFIQYTNICDGRPWETESNENNLIGAFLDYTDEDMYFFAQYLMDDFNLHWLLPDTPHNPNKMAYALGGRIDTEVGKFSFDAALAFKYTFEATYTSEDNYSVYPYEYTYYPSSTFIKDGEEATIDYVDNYIGYMYGENNIALKFDYTNQYDITDDLPLVYQAGLEYVISGSKSPSNPWHEASWHSNDGTKLLDEDVLEHTIKSTGTCNLEINNFEFGLGLTFGYVFNELALEYVVEDEAPIFVPQEGDNRWIFDVSLGIRYTLTL